MSDSSYGEDLISTPIAEDSGDYFEDREDDDTEEFEFEEDNIDTPRVVAEQPVYSIFSCGTNVNFTLGIEEKRVEHFIPLTEEYKDLFRSYGIPLQPYFPPYSIIDISTSATHTLFLSSNGIPYSCGINEGLQLGMRVENSVFGRLVYPKKIEFFIQNNLRVKRVCAGYNVSFFFCDNRSVWKTTRVQTEMFVCVAENYPNFTLARSDSLVKTDVMMILSGTNLYKLSAEGFHRLDLGHKIKDFSGSHAVTINGDLLCIDSGTVTSGENDPYVQVSYQLTLRASGKVAFINGEEIILPEHVKPVTVVHSYPTLIITLDQIFKIYARKDDLPSGVYQTLGQLTYMDDLPFQLREKRHKINIAYARDHSIVYVTEREEMLLPQVIMQKARNRVFADVVIKFMNKLIQ